MTRTAGIVRGVSHAAGNRLHALELYQHALEPGEPVPDDLAGGARAELDGFATLVERNRALAFLPDEMQQAWRVVEALPVAVGLRGLHVDVFTADCEIAVEGDPPAVLVPPRAFAQALLLLLLESPAGSGPAPAIAVRGEGESVHVVITHGAARDADDAAEAAVRWFLRQVAPPIALTRESTAEGAPCYRLIVPSLAASRAAERTQG
jgi:hypothetical protein